MPLLVLLLFSILFPNVGGSSIKAEAYQDPKHNVTRINLDKEATIELYQKWQDQAISGLMASVAAKKIATVSKSQAIAHEKCAKAADTVIKHAKCVSELLQQPSIKPSLQSTEAERRALYSSLKPEQIHQPVDPFAARKMKVSSSRLLRYQKKVTLKKKESSSMLKYGRNRNFKPTVSSLPDAYRSHSPSRFQKLTRFQKYSHSRYRTSSHRRYDALKPKNAILPSHNYPQLDQTRQTKIGAFKVTARKKRYSTHPREHYSLQSSQMHLTPLGVVAKHLVQSVLDLKNKTARIPWQQTMAKAQGTAALRKEIRKKARMHESPDLYEASAFRGMNFAKEDLIDVLEDPKERREFIQNIKSSRKDPASKLMGLLRDGLKLGHMLMGKNVSNFDEKNLKLMSPRLFSVTEEDGGDEVDAIDVLSPSLLSLHDSGKGLEKDLALPSLVKGFTTADQQQWLDLIFEAAGVEESLQKAEEALKVEEFQARKKRSYEERMRTPEGQPLYFTKEKAIQVLGDPEAKRIELFETLIKSYTPKQLKELNENGYAIMTRDQLDLLYGPKSPHKNLKMIESFGNRTEDSIHTQILDEINALATNESFQKRQRDIVLSPIIYANFINVPEATSQPAILSPILFTNIVGSPITLGPTILGPWGFLPLIASPRTLSPAILTPFFFVPVIMSPLTVHPIILSPGLFNPFVLSPLVLAPLILSPQVFTPLILSPLVLSPFILNPGHGPSLYLE